MRILGNLSFFIIFCSIFFTNLSPAQTPELRLPDNAAPVRYRVELTLDPAKDAFSGIIAINVDFKQSLKTLWLNGTDISVSDASLRMGDQTLSAKASVHGEDFLTLDFPSEIPAGKGELTIHYTGKVRQQNSSGVFAMEDSGNKYIFTQFESTDARGAFPCFDEPSYKVPWQVTLHVPANDTAISNTPIEQERNDNSDKTYVFRLTKPLPSYLVAFAVGPFEYVDAGRAGKNHFPVRIVVPKGHANEAKYAAEVTATILNRLEDYFGIPFPYDKSDQVAIPTTFGFGAMENPGMVTYGQNIILAEPARDTTNRQRDYAETAAHELAHQWFGDLVTTAWWNDIWLNEAFATWMEQKLIAEWKPEWKTRVEDVDSKLFAEEKDSLVSARKIRQEITKKDDISNAFDGITYQKGAAVIGMFESYLGAPEFRKGVQSYLKQYAFRNATAPEFLDAISTSSHQNITQPFSTFLNQAGVPVVTASLDCAPPAPVLHLEQGRSLPMGTKSEQEETWQIPVCLKYPDGSGSEKACVLITQARQDVALKTKSCPAWVQMNDGAVGYYQVDYKGDLFQNAESEDARAALNIPETVDFIGNVRSGVAAGRQPFSEELKLVELFHPSSDRHVIESTMAIAMQRKPADTVPKQWIPANLETGFQHFIESNFGPRAHEIGWYPKADENDDIRLLRPGLLEMVSTYGGDRELAREAKDLANRWLADHSSVDPLLVQSALIADSYYGDKTLFDRYLADLKKTSDRQARQRIEVGMIGFRDPAAIEAGFNAVLSGDVPFMEFGGYLLVFSGQLSSATVKLPFEFIKSHYDEIMAKRPTGGGFDFAAVLPRSGAGFCDQKSKAELKEFFEPRVDKLLGGRHSLNETLESIDVCIATKAARQPDMEAFFRKY